MARNWVLDVGYCHYYDLNTFLWQENIPIEEVFEKLKCTEGGLSSAEVQKRLEVFGYNKLEEKEVDQNLFILSLATFVYTMLYCAIRFLTWPVWSFDIFITLKESKILKFLGFMWNPLSWVMEAAAIMAIAIPHGKVKTKRFKHSKYL